MSMGSRDSVQILTTVQRLCGQPAIGPSGVADQSFARMRWPMAPPLGGAIAAAGMLLKESRSVTGLGGRWWHRTAGNQGDRRGLDQDVCPKGSDGSTAAASEE